MVMHDLEVGDELIRYQLRRNKRARHVSIRMSVDGMRVTVPVRANEKNIREVLYNKRDWILRQHERMLQKREAIPKISSFRTGAEVPFWDKVARLRVGYGTARKPEVVYQQGLEPGAFDIFDITLPRKKDEARREANGCGADPGEAAADLAAEASLLTWLTSHVAVEGARATGYYAGKLGLPEPKTRIRMLSSRWGSCGIHGTITLNGYLVFGPKRVFEYVAAHEVAHLLERNHGPAFWAVVAKIFGDPKPERRWLVKNGHLLRYQRMS